MLQQKQVECWACYIGFEEVQIRKLRRWHISLAFDRFLNIDVQHGILTCLPPDIKTLEQIQNRALRFIFRIRGRVGDLCKEQHKIIKRST